MFRTGCIARRRRLVPGVVLVGVGLAVTIVAPPQSARAGSRPRVPPTFTLTWSTGPLADQGSPIAESSPGVATLDGGGPAVVVGDRAGSVYAYHLGGGSPVPGWPVTDGGIPIDSSPSVTGATGGLDSVFVGTGNAADPVQGGYEAF